ncbi:Dna2-domain-containing protein [Serendipita vermifera]|nr:Dna2-domain-containing protein [Serendipita vermifera]
MNSDDASRTSKTQPAQPKETKPPVQQRTVPQQPSPSKEIKNLLEGAEDWDWSVDFDEPSIDEPAIPVCLTRQTPCRTRLLTCLKKERLPERVNAPDHSQRRVLSPHTRCVVKGVEGPTSARREKVLTVAIDDGSSDVHEVVLQGDWTYTNVSVGDIVNVIGKFTPTGHSVFRSTVTITTQQNFLILHPDILMTATAVANSTQCQRRPMISSLLKSTSDTTPALVWGNMLHEAMQACLAEGRWDEKWIDDKTDEIVRLGMESLVKLNINLDVAKIEIRKRARGLQAFSERFISKSPKPDAVLSDTRASRDGGSLLAICGLHDTEEDIWSPRYGLKGKLDASLQVILEEKKGPFTQKPKKVSVPFEIKTGQSTGNVEHRAQTMLYTILMEERYGAEVPAGLLYYTQSDAVIRVAAARNELRALIQKRNGMVAYMQQRFSKTSDGEAPPTFLPPTEDDERVCRKCYAVDGCMLYRKAVEGVEDTSSEISELYNLKTGHLTTEQCAFFKEWESLISLEEQEIFRFRRELWTMGAEDREKTGRCFANMVITNSASNPAVAGRDSSKIHQLTYTFMRKSTIQSAPTEADNASLLNGHITRGDAITVSIDPDFIAISRGFVLELNPESVTIGVDRPLDVTNLLDRYHASGQEAIFRIDKDELTAGIARIRNNLAHLFYKEGDHKRRELVVDLRPPEFDEIAPSTVATLGKKAGLNEDQRNAMAKVISAKDYAILLGMPGTGKTTVIAEIIKELVKQGKSVLLSSYTHSAVDTILMKLLDVDFEILRLGNVDKVHPDVHKMTLGARPVPSCVEELERQLLTPPVVATTCLSTDHRRTFDARKGGLDVSLFRRLSEAHPQAVVELAHQYRMNEDIMKVSNTLIYDQKLKCGDEAVATKTLKLQKPDRIQKLHASGPMDCTGKPCWLKDLSDEQRRVVFVDTDAIESKESKVGDLVQNETEAALVQQLVESLVKGGVEESEIGVISLYRQQIKLLSHHLAKRPGVEILTADRSQGRDKDCIIISMVRSNDSQTIGDLLRDWRRLNVTFTRARSKLVFFGSRKTLQSTKLLREFFELMERENWIYQLPKGADSAHTIRPVKRKREDTELDKENGPSLVSSPKKKRKIAKLPQVDAKPSPFTLAPSNKRKPEKTRSVGGNVLLKSRALLRDVTMEYQAL